MKKSTLIAVLFLATTFLAFEMSPEDKSMNNSNDLGQVITVFSIVESELLEMGYTEGMMKDVFRDNYEFFPLNSEELELTIKEVDKLIETGKYNAEDRFRLVEMSITALYIYEKNNEQVLQQVNNL